MAKFKKVYIFGLTWVFMEEVKILLQLTVHGKAKSWILREYMA